MVISSTVCADSYWQSGEFIYILRTLVEMEAFMSSVFIMVMRPASTTVTVILSFAENVVSFLPLKQSWCHSLISSHKRKTFGV